MFIRPQKYVATLGCKTQLNHRITELTLDLTQPNTINFYPGQFVSLEVAPDTYRAYSLTSSRSETTKVRLLIETAHEGKGSNYTRELQLGDPVTFIGPSGKFQLPLNLPENIVFVATGTGLAPFESMLYELITKKYPGKIDLFFGISNYQELFKLEFLKQCERLLLNFNYYICFSRELPSEEYNYFLGRVTDVIPTQILNSNNFERLKNHTLFLLCGNENMIISMKDILGKYGIKETNIITENFSSKEGYPIC